ncbi:hypothetical protein PISMIDRAFT_672762, partial [Pisolithus microcarpus 441]
MTCEPQNIVHNLNIVMRIMRWTCGWKFGVGMQVCGTSEKNDQTTQVAPPSLSFL